MKVIPPLIKVAPWCISDAMLSSSSAPEPGAGEVAWVSGAIYALGDVRILTATHRKYERLIAGAGAIAPNLDTANWLDVGPTNRWAMFDTLRNSKTVGATALTITLTPGQRVDAIALMGLSGSSVTVAMTVGASTVYTTTKSLTERSTLTWSNYFFGAFGQKESVALFNLPPYAGAVLTVTLAGSAPAIGAFVVGMAKDLGAVQYNPVDDVLNFSTVARDAFGNTTLIPRRSVPKTDQTLVCQKSAVKAIRALRADLDAVPAVWSGLDDQDSDGYFESLLILGVYKRFAINLSHPTRATINLQLEEI